MRVAISVVDKLNKALEVLVGIALASMTVIIFFQVLVRFVFSRWNLQISAPWTEEVARYLMIWSVFVGGAILARRSDSVAVEALVQAVPVSVGRPIKYCAHLIVLVFYSIVFMVGLEWVKFGQSEMAPVLRIPMAYVYASMSVGAALTMLNAVTHLIETYIDKTDILGVIDYEMEEALANVKNSSFARQDEVPELGNKLTYISVANKKGLTK